MAAEGPGLENGCPLSHAQTHQGSDVADVNQDGKAVSFDDGQIEEYSLQWRVG